jgi:CRISPR-associated protein Csx10
MQHLYIRLTAISPLAVRSDHAPGGAAMAPYISGTALVGALARVHRLLRPDDKEEFEQWFLRGQILYSNLYPATFDDAGLQERKVPVYPVPRTAQTCKRHKGFLFPVKEENDAHGVRDSLIDWAVLALDQLAREHEGREDGRPEPFWLPVIGDNANPLEALENHKVCPRCGERLDSFGGYYRRNDLAESELIAAKEHKRLRTHSGIDRETGTVQEGILYNRQVFEEGMRFWGMATFPGDGKVISKFSKFIDELSSSKLGNEGLLRIGTGRTRGMGKVKINVDRPKERQDAFELFRKRLNKFDDLLRKQAQRYNLGGLEDTFFFTLTLHSPLILCDELLRYRGNIDVSILVEELLKCSVPGLQRIYQNARVRRITGWQELWGTPRTNEYAIEAGSVFLFACKPRPGNEVYKALFDLEERGAGKRRIEGFGRVCVSDQFHQEVELL